MGRVASYTENEFRVAVEQSGSWREVIASLGLVQAGGTQTGLKEKARKLGLSVDHFHGQAWSAGRSFPEQKQATLRKHLRNGSTIKSHSLRLLLIETGTKQARCEECLRVTWNSEPIPLELHHVDSNKMNNQLDNLRVLCPNCHAQTPTHAGKGIAFHAARRSATLAE